MTAQTILDATAREYPGGSFYVVDRGARIEFLWSGDNARRAHAALARGLAAIGIDADDVPGMGVMVMKETRMISKTEAMAKLTEREEAEYALCEKQIDAKLREHSGRTIVDISPTARVLERLRKAYTAAGWTVDVGSDQRDGAWMAFT